MAEAFNTLAKRQRLPPKGGYKFPKADHVVSRVGPPPSPCKVCGSPKHWDKECPHKAQWDAMRTANIIQSEQDRSVDDDRVYSKAFEALLTQSISSLYIEPVPLVSPSAPAMESHSYLSHQVSIEEIYDEEGVHPR